MSILKPEVTIIIGFFFDTMNNITVFTIFTVNHFSTPQRFLKVHDETTPQAVVM